MSTIIYTITLQVLRLSVTCLIMFFIREHSIKVTAIILFLNIFSIRGEPPIFSSYLPPNQDFKSRPQNLNSSPIENSISLTTDDPSTFSYASESSALTNTLSPPLNSYKTPGNDDNLGQQPINGKPSGGTQSTFNPSSGYVYQSPSAPFRESQFQNSRPAQSQNKPYGGTQPTFNRKFSPPNVNTLAMFNSSAGSSSVTKPSRFPGDKNSFNAFNKGTPENIYDAPFSYSFPQKNNIESANPGTSQNFLSSYQTPQNGQTTQSSHQSPESPNRGISNAFYGSSSNPQNNNLPSGSSSGGVTPSTFYRPSNNSPSGSERQSGVGATNALYGPPSDLQNYSPSGLPNDRKPLDSGTTNVFFGSSNNLQNNSPSSLPNDRRPLDSGTTNVFFGSSNNLQNNSPSSLPNDRRPLDSGTTNPFFGSSNNFQNNLPSSLANDRRPLNGGTSHQFFGPSNDLQNNSPSGSLNGRRPSVSNPLNMLYGPPNILQNNSPSGFPNNRRPLDSSSNPLAVLQNNSPSNSPNDRRSSSNTPTRSYGPPNMLQNRPNSPATAFSPMAPYNQLVNNPQGNFYPPSNTYQQNKSPSFNPASSSTLSNSNPSSASTFNTYSGGGSPSNSFLSTNRAPNQANSGRPQNILQSVYNSPETFNNFPNSNRSPQRISAEQTPSPLYGTPNSEQNLAPQGSVNQSPKLTVPQTNFGSSQYTTPLQPSDYNVASSTPQPTSFDNGFSQSGFSSSNPDNTQYSAPSRSTNGYSAPTSQSQFDITNDRNVQYSTPLEPSNSTQRLPTSNVPSGYGIPSQESDGLRPLAFNFDRNYPSSPSDSNFNSETLSDFTSGSETPNNDFNVRNPASVPLSYLPPSYSNSYPTNPDVGIDPSTSYKLPNEEKSSNSEYGVPKTSKSPNRNIGSDLITGASTSPFGPYHSESSFSSETTSDSYSNKAPTALDSFGADSTQPAKYEFNYNVKDRNTEFSHQETRNGNSTQGSYDVILPDGRKQVVDYEANQEGFHPKIRYEDAGNKLNSLQDGLDSTASQNSQGYNYPSNQGSSYNSGTSFSTPFPSSSSNSYTPESNSVYHGSDVEPNFSTSSNNDHSFQTNPDNQDSYNPGYNQDSGTEFSSPNSQFPGNQGFSNGPNNQPNFNSDFQGYSSQPSGSDSQDFSSGPNTISSQGYPSASNSGSQGYPSGPNSSLKGGKQLPFFT